MTLKSDNSKPPRPLSRDVATVAVATAAILLLALAATQLGAAMSWDLFDFVLMGTLLATTGLMFVLVARHTPNSAHRMLAGVALALVLLLLWAELAVGVFGSPIAGS